jgi:hypothetical protein
MLRRVLTLPHSASGTGCNAWPPHRVPPPGRANDRYLFDFFAGEVRWGIPDPDNDYGHQPMNASKARLCDIVQETGAKTIHYLYDFGDSWDHVIKLEKWFDNTTTEGLPLLLEAAGGPLSRGPDWALTHV